MTNSSEIPGSETPESVGEEDEEVAEEVWPKKSEETGKEPGGMSRELADLFGAGEETEPEEIKVEAEVKAPVEETEPEKEEEPQEEEPVSPESVEEVPQETEPEKEEEPQEEEPVLPESEPVDPSEIASPLAGKSKFLSRFDETLRRDQSELQDQPEPQPAGEQPVAEEPAPEPLPPTEETEEAKESWNKPLKEFFSGISLKGELKLLFGSLKPKNLKEGLGLGAQIASAVNPVAGLMMILGNTALMAGKEAHTILKINNELGNLYDSAEEWTDKEESLPLSLTKEELVRLLDDEPLTGWEGVRLIGKLYGRQTSWGKLQKESGSSLTDKEKKAALVSGFLAAGVGIISGEVISKLTPVGSLAGAVKGKVFQMVARRGGLQYLVPRVLTVAANLAMFRGLEGEERYTRANEWVNSTVGLVSSLMTAYYTASVFGSTVGPFFEKVGEVVATGTAARWATAAELPLAPTAEDTASVTEAVEETSPLVETVTPAETETPTAETPTAETPTVTPTEEGPVEQPEIAGWIPGSEPPTSDQLERAVLDTSVQIGDETVNLKGFNLYEVDSEPDVWVDEESGKVLLWKDIDGSVARDTDGDGQADVWYEPKELSQLFRVGGEDRLMPGEGGAVNVLPAGRDMDLDNDGVKDVFEIEGRHYLDRDGNGIKFDDKGEPTGGDVELESIKFEEEDGVRVVDRVEYKDGSFWKRVVDSEGNISYEGHLDDGRQLLLRGGKLADLQRQIHEKCPSLSPEEVGKAAHRFQSGTVGSVGEAVKEIIGVVPESIESISMESETQWDGLIIGPQGGAQGVVAGEIHLANPELSAEEVGRLSHLAVSDHPEDLNIRTQTDDKGMFDLILRANNNNEAEATSDYQAAIQDINKDIVRTAVDRVLEDIDREYPAWALDNQELQKVENNILDRLINDGRLPMERIIEPTGTGQPVGAQLLINLLDDDDINGKNALYAYLLQLLKDEGVIE